MSAKSLDVTLSLQGETQEKKMPHSIKCVARKPKPAASKSMTMLATLGYGLTLAVIALFMLSDITFHI